MNNIQVFENSEFGSIRTVEIDKEPFFVGKDVADILEYQNGSRDINRHVDEEDRHKVMIFDGNQNKETIVINESGLYSLVLSSKLPTAKKFKRWVTSEVLPAIRKTGGYIGGAENMSESEIMARAVLIGQRTIEQQKIKIQNLEVENSELSVANHVMQPKADYFDELVDRNLLTNIRETAKQLRVGQKVFVNFLLDKKYLYRDLKGTLMTYAGKGDGLFEVKECFNDKTRWSGVQVLVTPKGREVFRLLCAGLTA